MSGRGRGLCKGVGGDNSTSGRQLGDGRCWSRKGSGVSRGRGALRAVKQVAVGRGPAGSQCGGRSRGRGQGNSVGAALAEESSPARDPSAGRGRGRGLPAPRLQGAQHRVQRLERGLLQQPESLSGHQPELQPLQQLGHDHLHLHLCAGGQGGGVSGVNERMSSKCHSCLGPQPPAPSPGTQSRALKCFPDKTSPRSHFWAETPALAPYLSKLLPNAGAGSQGEWEVGELRPACGERGVRRQPHNSRDKAILVMTGFGPGLVFEHAKDINS